MTLGWKKRVCGTEYIVHATACMLPLCDQWQLQHYTDVILSAMASHITGVLIVCSIIYSGADQRKHQSSVSLAFVRGIRRWPVNSPHKGAVTRKIPFYSIWWRHHELTYWGRRPFQMHFLENENAWISNKISLKFVPKGAINNIPALFQIMALDITLPHYHHIAHVSESIELLRCLSGTFCGVCVQD